MNSVNQISHAHALATLSCKPAAVLDSTKMKIDTIVLNYFTIVPIRTTILQSSKRMGKRRYLQNDHFSHVNAQYILGVTISHRMHFGH